MRHTLQIDSLFTSVTPPPPSVSAVFDYSYRDYILSWYGPLSRDEGQLHAMLSEDWWQMIGLLRARLADIDLVNVVCYDTIRVLHTHFTDLKGASARYTHAHTNTIPTDIELLQNAIGAIALCAFLGSSNTGMQEAVE